MLSLNGKKLYTLSQGNFLRGQAENFTSLRKLNVIKNISSDFEKLVYVVNPWYNYTYTYTCGNTINNNDERIYFFRKIYLSHFILERVAKGLCVRGELETEQTATYWPQVPLSLAALLSYSAGQLNRGSWGPKPSAGSWFSLSRTATRTPTNWLQLWHQVISLFDIHLLLVDVSSAPNSTRPQVKSISWCLRPDAPVPWLTAGSKVNMLHILLKHIFKFENLSHLILFKMTS